MSSSEHLDSARYPATAILIEQGGSLPRARPTAVSLALVVRRAEQVVAHAVKVGDQATASMMAEAFSRLVIYSSVEPGAQLPRPGSRAHASLHSAAIALIQRAYPDAWEQRERETDATCFADVDLSGFGKSTNEHQNQDDELADLLALIPASEEVN